MIPIIAIIIVGIIILLSIGGGGLIIYKKQAAAKAAAADAAFPAFKAIDGDIATIANTRIDGNYSGYPDEDIFASEIANDTSTYKELLLVGNQTRGVKTVGIMDNLNIYGDTVAKGSITAKKGIYDEIESSLFTAKDITNTGSINTPLATIGTANAQNITSKTGIFSDLLSSKKFDGIEAALKNITSKVGIFSDSLSTSKFDATDVNTQNIASKNGIFSDSLSTSKFDATDANIRNITSKTGQFDETIAASKINTALAEIGNIISTKMVADNAQLLTVMSDDGSIKQLHAINFDTEQIRSNTGNILDLVVNTLQMGGRALLGALGGQAPTDMSWLPNWAVAPMLYGGSGTDTLRIYFKNGDGTLFYKDLSGSGNEILNKLNVMGRIYSSGMDINLDYMQGNHLTMSDSAEIPMWSVATPDRNFAIIRFDKDGKFVDIPLSIDAVDGGKIHFNKPSHFADETTFDKNMYAKQNLNIMGDETIDGNLMVKKSARVAGPIYFANVDGGDDFDVYNLQKIQTSSNANTLRFTLNDDPDEALEIWGDSCRAGNCSGPGQKAQRFGADGNVWTRGVADIGGTLRLSGQGWTGYAASNKNSEIANDTTGDKALMIVGNSSAGGARKVKVWDDFDVANNMSTAGNVQTGGVTDIGGTLRVGGRGWTGYAAGNNNSEIANDYTGDKALMLVGNSSAGGKRKVRVYDDLDVYNAINTNYVNSNHVSSYNINGTNTITSGLSATNIWTTGLSAASFVLNGHYMNGVLGGQAPIDMSWLPPWAVAPMIGGAADTNRLRIYFKNGNGKLFYSDVIGTPA